MSLKGSYQCGGSFKHERRLVDSSERLKNGSDERYHQGLSISLSNDCLLISSLLLRCACTGLLSAPRAVHHKFPLTPLFEYKGQTELISLTQIDGVQVLQSLGLFNFNDTWLPEENTDNIKRMDQSLEASRSLGNLERV